MKVLKKKKNDFSQKIQDDRVYVTGDKYNDIIMNEVESESLFAVHSAPTGIIGRYNQSRQFAPSPCKKLFDVIDVVERERTASRSLMIRLKI